MTRMQLLRLCAASALLLPMCDSFDGPPPIGQVKAVDPVAEKLMAEFKVQVALSKVQTNPYRCVLAWFKQTFEHYDDYKAYFEAEAKKKARENDFFALVASSSVILEEDEDCE